MTTWPTRPLRALADVHLGRQRSPEHADGPHMVQYLRAANVLDGSLDLRDVKEMNFSPRDQEFFLLRSGDVLVTEGSGSLSTVGASTVWRGELPGIVCFQNTLLRLRPRSERTDPRYLAWWCRSAFADGLFASIATGANIYHLSAERLRAIPIKSPPLPDQRTIVDFLDAEASRIDALIGKKRCMMSTLEERRHAWLDRFFLASGRTYKLRRLLSQTPCYGVLVPTFVDAGVPFIRVGNISSSDITAEELPRISGDQSIEYRRTVVQRGDILLSVVGSIDKVGVVGSGIEGANVARAVARLVPGPEVPSRLLAQWFGTSQYFDQARQATQSDTAQPTLNMGDLAGFDVSFPAPRDRVDALRESRKVLGMHDAILGKLEVQIARLQEHRKASITAAVTGEMEIPGKAREPHPRATRP